MEDLTLLTTARYNYLRAFPHATPERDAVLALLKDAIGYDAPQALYGRTDNIPTAGTPIAPLPDLPKDRKFKIAIPVGHSRRGDSGAVSTNGISEHSFYSNHIVERLKERLEAAGYEVLVINFYVGNSYSTAMRWIAGKLKDEGVDFAVELHFNAATPKAEGFEYLHWHKSKRGVVAARAMQEKHAEFEPEQADRGVEPLGDQAHERGVLFTSLTHCPAIIAEPLFGTNAEEVALFMDSPEARERLTNLLFYCIEAGAQSLIESAA